MKELVIVRKNSYYDSVTLMTLSNKLKKLEGVADAVVAMASDMNKELLESIGIISEEVRSAGINDLLIAIKCDTEENCDNAYKMVDTLLMGSKDKSSSGAKEEVYPTIEMAKSKNEDLNLAVISVAGEFAAREARLALKNNMHVMLFSDNVSEEEELALKQMAHEKGLLVMGPDCGTAIINGVGLCFANKLKQGKIGLVAASGTGLQEVTVLIDNLGEGISQAIGTGGRDLSAKIQGIMMLDSLRLLEKDTDTEVIVLISKPPVKEVAEKIIASIKECKTPVVVCFIAGNPSMLQGTSAVFAASLEDTAAKAVSLLRKEPIREVTGTVFQMNKELLYSEAKKLSPSQKYIRGLYCGGTLASEATTEISKAFNQVYSNVAKKPENKIKDPMVSQYHTIIDLGDDIFTVGRPHPMIEPELRVERLLQEARDKETAVILMDFELGYGSHSDPVGVTIDAIQQIRASDKAQGRHTAIVAYILGTKQDYQGMDAQRAMLLKENVIVAQSNLHAVEMALQIAQRKGEM